MSFVDKIFGREKLLARIDNLEAELAKHKEEKKRLAQELEKADRRKKDAVTKKQELERKINRQEDKIDSLKDQLEKKEVIQSSIKKAKTNENLSRKSTVSFIKKLSSVKSDSNDMFTACIPSNAKLADVDQDAKFRYELSLNQLKTIEKTESNTGKIIYYSPSFLSYMIKPPLPVERDLINVSNKFLTEQLEESFDKKVGFVFLAAGGSAIATFSDSIEEKHILDKNIKNQHKKGGFSQSRFERLREEQVKELVDAATEIIEKKVDSVDKICLSGNKQMLAELRKTQLYEDNKRKIFERSFNISKITDTQALEAALNAFWNMEVSKF